jgi:hypothetical protein
MTNKQIKPWEIERYLLGELPPSRMEEISRLIRQNPDLSEEIDNVKRSHAEVMKRHPIESMLPGILKKYEENRQQARVRERASLFTLKRLLYATPVVASVLILLFVVFVRDGTRPGFTRIKGEESVDFAKTQIIIYRQNPKEIELLDNQSKAKAGDLLQLAYVPAGKTHGVIFSIDGNGVVTLHYPESRNDSSLLKQERKNLLSSAYELDNAPDFERFFFITAMEEIDVTDILKKAEALALSPALAKTGNLKLPYSYHQFSILLNKEKPND